MFHILALTLAAALAPAQVTNPQPPAPITGLDISVVSIARDREHRNDDTGCRTGAVGEDVLLSGDEAARKTAAQRLGGSDATVVVLHDLAPVTPDGIVAADIALRGWQPYYLGLRARVGADGALGPIEVGQRPLSSATGDAATIVIAKPGAPGWYALEMPVQGCVLVRLEPSTSAPRSAREIVPLPTAKADTQPEPVTPARIVDRPGLVYPLLAYRQGREGTVGLRAVVDHKGRVAYARITAFPAGSEDLGLAALDAVVTWSYEPARRGKDATPSAFATNIAFARAANAPPAEPAAAVESPIVGRELPRPLADARLAVGGGLNVRLYTVTGKPSSPAPGASCAPPAQALPIDAETGTIARTFGGATATRLWEPVIPVKARLVRFFGATRHAGGRLSLTLLGQTDDAGNWDVHLTLRDLDSLQWSGPRDVRLAPGGTTWLVERLQGQCVVARLSADPLVDRPFPPAPNVGARDAADEPRSVTGEITPPVLVKRVEPKYPLDARKQQREGSTRILAVIEADGSVTSAAVQSYPEEGEDLAFATLVAVSQWQYKPAMVGGQPVRVYFTVQVTYRLE